MSGFVNNINYVAGLDSKYGNKVVLYKSNVALGAAAYDIKIGRASCRERV